MRTHFNPGPALPLPQKQSAAPPGDWPQSRLQPFRVLDALAAGRARTSRSAAFGSGCGTLRRREIPGVLFRIRARSAGSFRGFSARRSLCATLLRSGTRAAALFSYDRRSAKELGQHGPGALRIQGFGPPPVSGSAIGIRPLFEHPAREERQGRLLHHLVQQHDEFAAEICDVFQFGKFKIAQRSIRAIPKIIHRRFRHASHDVSPVGWYVVICSPRPVSVTEPGPCAKQVSPVEIFPLPGSPYPPGIESDPPRGRPAQMCSGCSGDPEDPAEGRPALEGEDDSPFWAMWRNSGDDPEEVEVRK